MIADASEGLEGPEDEDDDGGVGMEDCLEVDGAELAVGFLGDCADGAAAAGLGAGVAAANVPGAGFLTLGHAV